MSIVQDVRECFRRQISHSSHIVVSDDDALRSQVAELETAFGSLPSEFGKFIQEVGFVEMFHEKSPGTEVARKAEPKGADLSLAR